MLDFIHSLFSRMPVQASAFASRVDNLNNFITYVAAFCTLAMTVTMLYFAVKYKKSEKNNKSTYISHNSKIEILWTVVPTIVCAVVFYSGFSVYREMRTPPTNAIEIVVIAQKWNWTFIYPNGKRDSKLVTPVNQPIKLIGQSKDVNHSIFIPAMRVKEDVINGTYHYLWFTPILPGEYKIFCTEYCGTSHSQMLSSLQVVSYEEYVDYLSERKKEELPPEKLGEKLYNDKGCKACHSLDGAKVVGPSFKAAFGTKREFAEGEPVTADENYLKESILVPNKKVVKGYPPNLMPAFEGQLNEEEVLSIIAFIKAQK